MSLVATIEIVVLYLTAFGARSLWQWSRTGKTGFLGLRKGASAIERFAAFLMVLTLGLAPIAPWVGEPLWAYGHALGALIAAAGIVLTLVAQMQMGRSWRIGVDTNERTELVTSGVFAVVRNPIFSAMLLATIGLALTAPTAVALTLPPLLLVALEIQVRVVEEPYLRQLHGERYESWAARTGRFVPWFGLLRT